MERPDIGILYADKVPSEFFDDFLSSISDENLNILIESRGSDQHFACLEWFIPSVIGVFLAKSYFDGFVKEAGKDHYQLLKTKLSNLSHKSLETPKIEPVLFGTTGKLSTNNPYSLAFSVHAEATDGKVFKLLLPKPTEGSDYTLHIYAFLEYLSDFHSGVKNYGDIGYQEQAITTPGGLIFVHYNERKECIEWLNEKEFR